MPKFQTKKFIGEAGQENRMKELGKARGENTSPTETSLSWLLLHLLHDIYAYWESTEAHLDWIPVIRYSLEHCPLTAISLSFERIQWMLSFIQCPAVPKLYSLAQTKVLRKRKILQCVLGHVLTVGQCAPKLLPQLQGRTCTQESEYPRVCPLYPFPTPHKMLIIPMVCPLLDVVM